MAQQYKVKVRVSLPAHRKVWRLVTRSIQAALLVYAVYCIYIRYNGSEIHQSVEDMNELDRTKLNSFASESLNRRARITEDAVKKKQIKSAFQWAYNAYERDAFGKDNYHPISQSGHDMSEKGPVGYFIIDILDSLKLFGMEDEFNKCRNWVMDLSFDIDDKFHTFEITIRVLGGLLAAYSMSENDPIFLEKAIDLADRLLPTFDTPSGIPTSFINLHTGIGILDSDNRDLSSAAEAGTLQLEFKYLSEITGDPKYWNRVERVMDVIRDQPKHDGLVPILMSTETGAFIQSDIRLGSRGDSYYEYLLKQYLQTNRTEPVYRTMYDEAMSGTKSNLIQQGVNQGLTYTKELVPRLDKNRKIHLMENPKQDHLVCFLPGSLMLGSATSSPVPSTSFSATVIEDLRLGEDLLAGCYDTYDTLTGLSPEITYWFIESEKIQAKARGKDWYIRNSLDAKSMLRPETVESIFLAYRITGKDMYREWGWKIFEAIETHARIPTGGYATIKHVDQLPVVYDDNMETFFLAETLKYLYLLFEDESVVPLDSYVFNTEAHILPIFTPTVRLH